METFLYTRVQHSLSHYDYQTAIFLCEQLLSLCQTHLTKPTLEERVKQIINPSINQSTRQSISHAFTHSVILLLAQCYFECGDGVARAHHLLRTTLSKYASSAKQSISSSTSQSIGDSISHRYLLARCCMSLGLQEEAETVMNGAVDLINQSNQQLKNQPSNQPPSQFSHTSLIYYWLGVINQSTSRIKDARRFFELSISADSWNWSAYQALISLGPDDQDNPSTNQSIFDNDNRPMMDYASKMFQMPSLDEQTSGQSISQPMFTINVPVNQPAAQSAGQPINQSVTQTPGLMTPNNPSQYSTPLPNQLHNQSFNLSFNHQLTNQSTQPSVNQSIHTSINPLTNQSRFLSIKQPMFMTPASRSLSSIINRTSINQTLNLSMVTPPVSQATNQPMNQPVNRPTRPTRAPAIKQSPSSSTPKRTSVNRMSNPSAIHQTPNQPIGSSISQSFNQSLQSTTPFRQPAPRINTALRQSISQATTSNASPRKSPRMTDVTPRPSNSHVTNQSSNQPINHSTSQSLHSRALSRSRVTDEDEAMEVDDQPINQSNNPPVHSPVDFDLADEPSINQSVNQSTPINLSVSQTISLFQTLAQAAELLADYECKKCINLLNQYLSLSNQAAQHAATQATSQSTSQSLNQSLSLTRSFLTTNQYLCLLYGRCSFELCDWSACIAYFVMYQSINPFSLSGLDYYSSALWQTNRAAELSALSINLTTYPSLATHPVSLIVGANSHSLHKDHAQSLQFLARAQSIYQNTHHPSPASVAYAFTLAGHESLSLDDVIGASTCYRRALAYDQRSFGAWFGLAHVFGRQDLHEQALYHLKQAALINRHSIPILLHLGKTALSLEDYEVSQACLDAARAEGGIGSACAQIEYHASQLAIALSDWQTAWEALLRVSALAPREASVYAAMARVALKCGDAQQAIRCANHALDLDPKDANHAKSVIEQVLREGKEEEEEEAY